MVVVRKYREPKAVADKKYVDSGIWKCDQSPNGAHYWIIKGEQHQCKYCKETKHVDFNNQLWSYGYNGRFPLSSKKGRAK